MAKQATTAELKQWTTTEYSNLYQASEFLTIDNKKTLGLLMPVDVYVQNPFVAAQNRELAAEFATSQQAPQP